MVIRVSNSAIGGHVFNVNKLFSFLFFMFAFIASIVYANACTPSTIIQKLYEGELLDAGDYVLKLTSVSSSTALVEIYADGATYETPNALTTATVGIGSRYTYPQNAAPSADTMNIDVLHYSEAANLQHSKGMAYIKATNNCNSTQRDFYLSNYEFTVSPQASTPNLYITRASTAFAIDSIPSFPSGSITFASILAGGQPYAVPALSEFDSQATIPLSITCSKEGTYLLHTTYSGHFFSSEITCKPSALPACSNLVQKTLFQNDELVARSLKAKLISLDEYTGSDDQRAATFEIYNSQNSLLGQIQVEVGNTSTFANPATGDSISLHVSATTPGFYTSGKTVHADVSACYGAGQANRPQYSSIVYRMPLYEGQVTSIGYYDYGILLKDVYENNGNLAAQFAVLPFNSQTHQFGSEIYVFDVAEGESSFGTFSSNANMGLRTKVHGINYPESASPSQRAYADVEFITYPSQTLASTYCTNEPDCVAPSEITLNTPIIVDASGSMNALFAINPNENYPNFSSAQTTMVVAKDAFPSTTVNLGGAIQSTGETGYTMAIACNDYTSILKENAILSYKINTSNLATPKTLALYYIACEVPSVSCPNTHDSFISRYDNASNRLAVGNLILENAGLLNISISGIQRTLNVYRANNTQTPIAAINVPLRSEYIFVDSQTGETIAITVQREVKNDLAYLGGWPLADSIILTACQTVPPSQASVPNNASQNESAELIANTSASNTSQTQTNAPQTQANTSQNQSAIVPVVNATASNSQANESNVPIANATSSGNSKTQEQQNEKAGYKGKINYAPLAKNVSQSQENGQDESYQNQGVVQPAKELPEQNAKPKPNIIENFFSWLASIFGF